MRQDCGPRLSNGWIHRKAKSIHWDSDLPLERGYVAFAGLYGLAYALVVLALACVAFERKEFN